MRREQRSETRKVALKRHNLVHFEQFLREYGNGLELDTSDSEHDHKENVKALKFCAKRGSDLSKSAPLRRVEMDRARSVVSYVDRKETKPRPTSRTFKKRITAFGLKYIQFIQRRRYHEGSCGIQPA